MKILQIQKDLQYYIVTQFTVSKNSVHISSRNGLNYDLLVNTFDLKWEHLPIDEYGFITIPRDLPDTNLSNMKFDTSETSGSITA